MRFAILTHDHPFPHWDLLLEAGELCRTWRLLLSPDAPGPIPAEALADHRRLYLDYEGPVSGDRGTVTRWDAGKLVWLTALPDRVACLCQGSRISGLAQLRCDQDSAQCHFEIRRRAGIPKNFGEFCD